MAGLVGSIEPGKLADLVLYQPGFFGVSPELVIKGGIIAWARPRRRATPPSPRRSQCSPAQCSAPAPRWPRPHPLAFVAPAALEAGLASRIQTDRPLVAVASTRRLTKADLPENDALPSIRVEPDSFTVFIDGEPIIENPADVLPMAQRYFLF